MAAAWIALCAVVDGPLNAASANQQPRDRMDFRIIPADPPNDGILFVDHARANRSGHLGHALVEYADGKLLAFYPNCSTVTGGLSFMGPEWSGHNADGWMEYRRSVDGGQTWGDPIVLAYSKAVYDAQRGRSVFSEKALLAPDGTIVLFNLECDISTHHDWSPTFTPTYLRSTDGGESWSPPRKLGAVPGRVYDAIRLDRTILVLKRQRSRQRQRHVLYASTDHGRTFEQRSRLPFEGRYYGTLAVLHDGGLIAYVYNPEDEQQLDYAISHDQGVTWSDSHSAFFAAKIRNPQMTAFRDGFVLHGRSGHLGPDTGDLGHLVLYTSRDGVNWDAGQYLRMKTAGTGAYSNNLLVKGGKRLLIQASHAYEQSKTNILHWWLE